ncbi:MAG: restriction endonuclease subunit S [Dolichospermum sp.]
MSNRLISVGKVCKLNKESISLKDTPEYIYYLDTGNITQNKINNLQYLTREDGAYPSRAKRKVKENTIIYSTVRPNQEHFGIIKNPDINLIVSTGFTTIDVIDKDIDPLYLYYSITRKQITYFLQSIAENSVSSYPSINSDDIGKLKLKVPSSKQEQKKIAAVLSSLDDKIELNNRINSELENLAKTIYDYWFVQFDFPDENGTPYKSSGGKMVYNQELKRAIPAGWEVGTLSKLGDIAGGSTPSTKNPLNFCHNGTAWITPKDLSLNVGNKFISRGELDVTDAGIKEASLKIYPKGTILLSSRAPIGYMAVARNEVTTNQGFKSFIPNKRFSIPFVYYTVKNSMNAIIKQASGSTFKEVSLTTLKDNVYICLPSNTVVDFYTKKVNSIFKQQDILEQENQQLTQLRDWLLPMLMNGQITVK